jgi:2-C-methyl-D-erythritol 2,4-cyclodiphosphate synthase
VGTDLHRLIDGRPLMMGGVRIPHSQGPAGHSDGDVVLHAVTDAILGAAGLPDIGELFPDTDPAFAGADSGKLLVEALGHVQKKGYSIGNLDIVVQAEAPKISPHKDAMACNIAELLNVDRNCVNLKAKTGEGIGEIGRGEAISCIAVVLLLNTNKVRT